MKFLSTPSARRATSRWRRSWWHQQISIHALREEGDQGVRGSCVNFIISIHALREEGDVGFLHLDHRFGKFLSTPSARRATDIFLVVGLAEVISIHALREEGDECKRPVAQLDGISIHALREEGDWAAMAMSSSAAKFLSTPSARRATPAAPPESSISSRFLSTPSARRATCVLANICAGCSNFYPRPPRGGRRGSSQQEAAQQLISIHALREEGDPGMTPKLHWTFDFYPRPPRGGRPRDVPLFLRGEVISIHALREEGDRWRQTKRFSPMISIHALREEGDRWRQTKRFSPMISIHALREEGDSKNRDKISIFKQIIQHSARI